MSAIEEVLKSVAPGIATALGGPLAGMAAGWLASKLGVPADKVQETMAGMNADQLVKMKELDLQFQQHMADNGIALQLAQIDVNKEQAKSINWFVAGARPAAMWIGVFGFAYAAIIEPAARFVAMLKGYTGAFPALDTTITMQLLFGLLGIAGMRMNEKVKGVQDNH